MKISIIIPLYNKRNSIKRVLNSIFIQKSVNGLDYEVIVVNDGSTDDSLNMMNDYFSKIKLITQDNKGVSAARNMGFSVSNGDIIYFLDADDELLPNAFENIFEIIKSNPDGDFYSSSIELVNEKGESFDHPNKNIKNFYTSFLFNPFLLTSSSTFYRREFYLKFSGFPEGHVRGEDIYLWLLMGYNGKFYTSNKLISRIYRNSENRSIDINKYNDQIPYFLDFFLNNNVGNTYYTNNYRLRILIIWLSLKNMLGSMEVGSTKMAKKIVTLFLKNNIVIGSFFLLLSLSPIKLISLIRNFRN